MALDKIESNGQTNATWRGVIDAGIDLLNNDVLQHGTQLTITQSGGESTTQCVVSGHTSATFNASDYSNSASLTINKAIESLPKNMGGHNIDIIVGTTDGQEITISSQIDIGNFEGGVVTVKSAKPADNGDDGSTKANKIVSAGAAITRIFSINKCSECNIQGLELKQTTGTDSGYVVVVSTSWSDINHCKLTANFSTHQVSVRGLLSQRGANVWLRDSWVDNVSTGILINNSGIAAQTNCSWTGTQPVTGMYASKSIGITDSSQNIQGSTNEYLAANGGIITNEQGLIFEETILTGSKTVNIAAGTSVSDIQDIINNQPRNLNGYNLTFQFADGTYDFGTTQLGFTGFEGGSLIVQGNQSEDPNAAGGGLSVVIQSENTADAGAFFFQKCSRVVVNRIRFEQNGSNNDTVLLRFFYGTQGTVLYSSFANLNGTRRNRAVYYHESEGLVRDCKFNNFENNVNSIVASRVCSRNTATFSGSGNDQDATNNIRCESGSITTQAGTQAGGSASKNDGGVIFTTSGTLA